MTREKEIEHRLYEIRKEINELKKEAKSLHIEFNQIYGEKRLERTRKRK